TWVDYYKDENTSTSLHEGYGSQNYGQTFDYAIITPWKSSIGLTKFFGRGLLSTDIEYVNYSSIKYREVVLDADPGIEGELTHEIQDNFKGVFNFKIGGEYLFTERLAGRAGFHLIGSPYKGDSQNDYIASLGLGYVLTKSLYVDLTGMQYKQFNYSASP